MAWAFRINGRVSRLFGEREAGLGRLATEGDMETLRQSSLLYTDLNTYGFSLPSDVDDELPRRRLLDRVQALEPSHGLPAD